MKPTRQANGLKPWFEAPEDANRCAAFTFLELLVIVSLLALLLVIQWPALAKATHQTARAQCAANLRQVTMAFHIYATENSDKLPAATAGFWAWDIPWNLATTLGRYGAPRNALYCPANPEQNMDPLWNYVSNSFRVIDYALTLVGGGSISSTNWNASLTPQPIAYGPAIMPPLLASRRVLLADATLSQPGQDNEANRAGYNYSSIASGFSQRLRTSHLDGFLPAGGNLAMVDGHVEWRVFSQMHVRTPQGSGTPVFWW
jgi:prepilin-type processing-associated H-X9-DG protein